MRAMRTTWLLLSLSCLSPSIYSTGPTVTTKIPTGLPSSAPTVVATIASTITTPSPAKATSGTTVAPPAVTVPTKPTQAPTKPTTAATSTAPPSTRAATTKPEPTTLQVVTDKNNPTKSPNPPGPTTVASITSISTITAQAATTGAKTTPVAIRDATVRMLSTSVASKITDGPVNPPGGAGHHNTTMTPAPLEQTSTSLTSTAAVTSQEGSNKGSVIVSTTAHVPTQSQDRRTSETPGVTQPTPSQVTAVLTTTDADVGNPHLPATTAITTTPSAKLKDFTYSLQNEAEDTPKKDKHLVDLCKWLMLNWESGTCTLRYSEHNRIKFESVKISGTVRNDVADKYYEESIKEPTDNKTLIAILASCGALLIMIVILAVCASHHRKPYNENQQHLTEELNTVENGYHDNPTLEVMEVQPEMQEKKVALNGEFNDNWIVPIDNLIKEDIPDEEDTHL